MKSKEEKYSQILLAIDRGELVITGSQRLAREIVLHHADRMSAVYPTWVRPAVWSWSEWMRELWLDSAWLRPQGVPLRLLSAGRKKILWEGLIRQSGLGGGLIQLHTVARAAVEAWDLACAWQISLESIANLATEDAAQFLEWAKSYEALCQEKQLLDEALLPQALADFFVQGTPGAVPDKIMLAGFDELTPAQQHLLTHMETAGTDVRHWMPEIRKGKTTIHCAPDFEAELAAAAYWSLDCLANNRYASIGIVVPDLAISHAKVNRIFTEILAPAALEGNDESQENLFSISAGAPLLAQPLVAKAIDLLLLAGSSPSWSTVSQLLRSQFIGDAITEANRRAAFDVKLRKSGGIRWSLRWLQERLQKEEEKGSAYACPALRQRLLAAVLLEQDWPERQTTREWVMAISAWLDALGWPGERVLSSSEYQAQQRWRELLEEAAAYEDELGPVTLSAVAGLLRNIAGSAIFKPESARSPILVLGTLEAAGLQFDHIWVSGLHDGAWPPAPAPTPFLPYSLQRTLMVPRGSAARELKFARLVLERLVSSAADVRLSWPQAEGDEPLRSSPLLDRYEKGEELALSNLALDGRSGEIFRMRPGLLDGKDGIGPGCEDGFSAPGGARVLELQSLCPFRAFAELRLGARQLEQPSAGLNPRQRGQLAHDSLYFLWQGWKSQAALAAIDVSRRKADIAAAIQKAASKIQAQGNPILQETLEIEKARLAELLFRSSTLESQRPDFTVTTIEERRKIQLGKLNLSVRADRIDKLPGDGHLVIDYKTGEVSASKWFGDRPRDPQLLLYATAMGVANVRAISFLQIRAATVKFVGLCDNEEGMPAGVKVPGKSMMATQGVGNWDELLVLWKTILGRLANSFSDGEATVNPLKGACTYCHLQAACRIEEKKRSGEVAADV